MKKFKLMALIGAALAVSLLALTACGGGQAQNAPTSADTSAAPAAAPAAENAFIVGFDAEYPPYGFKDADGSYTGFDLDLAKAVCDMNGWEFEAKPIDWDGKDLELDSGNITCIWNGFTRNDERENQYAWSEPYMLNEQVFVVSADSDITSYENMGGKKVVTQAASAAYGILTDDEEHEAMQDMFDGGQVATVPDYNTAFMQLESGAVDVVACDLSIAAYQMSQNPDKYVQLAEPLNSEVYAVGFKLGNDEMAATVTESLKKLDADGTVQALVEKYAEYGMDYSNWILK